MEDREQERVYDNEQEEEGDPGFVIQYSSDSEVHQVLGLPAVAQLVPPLQQGVTPAESARNLKEWVDSIVARNSGRYSFVLNMDQSRAHGLYHRMQQHEHAQVMSALCQSSAWTAQCMSAVPPLSAGRIYSVEGAGKGFCNIIQINLGPFALL